MGLFDEVKGEIEAFSCFKKPDWLKSEAEGNGVPWRDNEDEAHLNKTVGLRQHAFKSIWERSLEPRDDKNNNKGNKTSKLERWSIDWKKWPPNFSLCPKGVRIPIAFVPQIDLRLSLSGHWNEISHGTTVAPVNYGSKKFFDNLGGHLNIAQSLTFKVTPTSLLFLHSKAGQFYSVKVKLSNNGNIPRRARILSPANRCFTVLRQSDPKDVISPGYSLVVEVQYRPKSNESLNDSLVFIVDNDGAIVVPLISSTVPEPILEVEEWNCGCCVVGIPRTAYFDVKNVGGPGRFWILSEHEFTHEYLDCYLRFKKNMIKQSTREMVKLHTEAIHHDFNVKTNVIGRGEYKGFIKRTRDSLDDEEEDIFEGVKTKGKIKPRIYTNCFRIQPSCFRLQRNQRISIKVRYLPKDANFHYEKLCILCENGEVRWIAVKGLGIERDSDKLIEIKALWTGPPIDLPSDPRTKFVMDCGDLLSGEMAKLRFSIVNKSCIPLYFFWTARPVLTDPEASPEKAVGNIVERFFEATIYDVEESNLLLPDEEKPNESWKSQVPMTVYPAQGMLEKKQELQMIFKAECPIALGYHACIISLFVEQVDEESRATVLETLKELDKEQLNRPISHAHLTMELPSAEGNGNPPELKKDSIQDEIIFVHPTKSNSIDITMEQRNRDIPDEAENEDDFVPLKDTIKEIKANSADITNAPFSTENNLPADEMLIPLAVAKRSSQQLAEKLQNDAPANASPVLAKDDVVAPYYYENVDDIAAPSRKSNESERKSVEKKESINIHFLPDENNSENDREMYQGHGVYEELINYTENIIPQYKLWPNRDKTLTPVAEVEIWFHSVPLDVTFSPPFIVVNGLVKTSIERLVKVRNGSLHAVEMNFENISDDSIGAMTCHPRQFMVKPHQTFMFKIAIYFEKCGEMQKILRGSIKLPFSTTPCFISTYLRSYGPFLEALTPTINFGIVPYFSEKMKTLALKNGGNRPLKWVARIAPEGLEDEDKREISGHQARIHDKRLIRIWPEWGVIDAGHSAGIQVYFCAELSGEIASYIEVMVEGNPQSMVSIPVYGEIELPSLVLENGRIKFYAADFVQQAIQNGTCVVINPTGFNVAFSWQCPVGRQSKLCNIYIHPKQGVIPAKAKMEFSVCVETFTRDEPLILDNLFVPCCVEGMREPLILKISSEY